MFIFSDNSTAKVSLGKNGNPFTKVKNSRAVSLLSISAFDANVAYLKPHSYLTSSGLMFHAVAHTNFMLFFNCTLALLPVYIPNNVRSNDVPRSEGRCSMPALIG